ncbi:glycosyltransferase [Kocuria sp. cx-116]|uniref:glycosyltransferase n=1 Tax=Kocuria sp. cx-116 TaxID=2771378 RepID=UPI001CC24F94|nr:glycosyltransferase [Kocuria sp. cx-116]
MLNVEWVNDHAHEFDVFHLHFGFDAVPPAELQRIVAALHANGKPLVYTVHDLRNPHQTDPSIQDAALNVLIPAADQLITLTTGAAQEIKRRWGRDATVVPHPHVVPLEVLDRPRPRHTTVTVGLHLKSMRTNMNPLPVLRTLLAEIRDRDMHLLIDVHPDVLTPGMPHHNHEVCDLLDHARDREDVRIHVHDFYTDDQLWDYLMGVDLSVLAYRFGTHSGWLEACYDLGTRVLAPSVGFYHQQHPGVLRFDWDDHGQPDAEQIAAALDGLASSPPWRTTRSERTRQRQDIAREHSRIYHAATAGRSS